MSCKKFFFHLIFLTIFLFTNSCVTKSLWDRKYNETFRQFLVSNDGEYVVFLGNNFHYIFTDNSAILKELLLWTRRDLLFINTEKTYLKLTVSNNMEGYATIESFYKRLPPQEEKFLKSLGFRSENGEALSLKILLRGRRFLPRADLGKYLPTLDRAYVIPIHVQSRIFGNLGKVALTPITVTLDATIIIGKVLLQPFRGK